MCSSDLLFLLAWFDRWSKRRFPRYAAFSRRSEQLVGARRAQLMSRVFFVAAYAILFTMMYAERVAENIKRGSGRRVQAELVNGTPVPAELPMLLGTTAKFVFLYYPSARRTHVVPAENIARIVVNSTTRDDPPVQSAPPAAR